MGRHCCICGRAIRPDYWACCHCRRRYKLPDLFADWPEWAKALKSCEQEERLLSDAENVQQPVDPAFDPDCLPTDPYDNEADNLTYRRVNKVTR